MSTKTKVILPLAVLIVMSGGVWANEDHSLNHVWSRIADINGEFGSVESAEFSPGSEFIVTGTKYDNTVRLFRTEDGHLLWKTELPAEIERVAWTADGKTVVSVSEDHYLRIIRSSDGKILKAIKHDNAMDSLALSHDGRIMAVGEEMRGQSAPNAGDGTAAVVLYDTGNWQEILRVDQVTTANEIAFTPDDRYFVVVGHLNMRLWETASGRQVHHQAVFEDGESRSLARFICAKVSPDNRYIAVGANQGWLYFFDAKTGEYLRRINKTGQKIETVEWTKDSKYVLTSGKGNVIDFFKVEHALDTSLNNGSVPIAMRVPLTDQLEYMHFNQNGSMLTTAHQDGTVQLWTYMSDNPGINQRSHRALSRQQREQFGQ